MTIALTREQLLAAQYFVVGFGTEGGSAANRLSIAGVPASKWGAGAQVLVAANSGYTVGMLQFDLGQRGLAAVGSDRLATSSQLTYIDALLQNMQQYGAATSSAPQLEGSLAGLRAQLLTHGQSVEFISPANRAAIDAYLSSTAGSAWVHQNMDLGLVSVNTDKAYALVSKYGQDWTYSEQFQAGMALAKIYNQSPKAYNGVRDAIVASGSASLSIGEFHEYIKAAVSRNPKLEPFKAEKIAAGFAQVAELKNGLGAWLDSALAKTTTPGFCPPKSKQMRALGWPGRWPARPLLKWQPPRTEANSYD